MKDCYILWCIPRAMKERLCIIPCICSKSESTRKLALLSQYAVIPGRGGVFDSSFDRVVPLTSTDQGAGTASAQDGSPG